MDAPANSFERSRLNAKQSKRNLRISLAVLMILTMGEVISWHEAEARLCFMHETLVQQHKKKMFGLHTKIANVTIVKFHSCPIYAQCCNIGTGCCFDYPWFWTSMAAVVFTGIAMGLWAWYRKKRARITGTVHSHPAGSARANTGMEENPLNPASQVVTSPPAVLLSRGQGLLEAQGEWPKPPPYSNVSGPMDAVLHLPPAEVVVTYDQAPPPYSPRRLPFASGPDSGFRLGSDSGFRLGSGVRSGSGLGFSLGAGSGFGSFPGHSPGSGSGFGPVSQLVGAADNRGVGVGNGSGGCGGGGVGGSVGGRHVLPTDASENDVAGHAELNRTLDNGSNGGSDGGGGGSDGGNCGGDGCDADREISV